ncbi:hypothetical protein ACFW34_30625 [Streptomyces sp. NPDC058848]|uniref:hypothetical protein n=1 Tax=unclassified Streptomyces TaxID=2593676 RepID=UPI0036A82EFA
MCITSPDCTGTSCLARGTACREIMQEAMRPVPVEVPTEAPQEADGYEEAV